MQQVQNDAYALTDELRRIQKDEKASAAQRAIRAREIARKDTEKLLSRTESGAQPKKEYVPLKDAQPGQEVVIADLNQLATVLSRPGRDGMVEVRAGILKTKVPLSGLRAPDKMEKAPAPAPAWPASRTTVQLDHDRRASMELNLLGYTVEEALAETDKFIDNAVLRGPEYRLHHPRQGHRRAARRHPEAPAHPQERQELPPGPLRRGRDRRDRGGAEITRCTKQKDGIPPPKGTYAVFSCLAFGLRLRLGSDRLWQSPNCPASVRHRVSLPAL